MLEFILSRLQELMRTARDYYGVNPVIFLILFLGSAPFFYYSLFRLGRALLQKSGAAIRLWSFVFLCATAAPFVYVLLFGRHLPWWIYIVIALLIGQGVFSLIRQRREKS